MKAIGRKPVPACALHAAINEADERMGVAMSHLGEVVEHWIMADQIDQRHTETLKLVRGLLAGALAEPAQTSDVLRAARGMLGDALNDAELARWHWGKAGRYPLLRARNHLKSGLQAVQAQAGRCRCSEAS